MWKKWSKRTFLLLFLFISIIGSQTTGHAKLIKVDSETFPDPAVLDAVESAMENNGIYNTGYIDTASIKKIYVSDSAKDLTGLELFTKLEELEFEDDHTYTLSQKNEKILNSFSKLKTLIFNGKLNGKSLKLSLPKLQTFDIPASSKLASIDVSSCSKLKRFYAGDRSNKGLKKIILPKSGSIKALYLSANPSIVSIPNLKLQKNIETLWLEDVKITSLDASKFTKLKELRCEDTKIKTLNLTHSKKLSYLSVNPSVTKQIRYASHVGKDFYLNLVNKKAKNLTLKNYMPSGYTYAGVKENSMQPKKSINPGSKLTYNSKTTHVTVKKDYEDALLLFKKGNSVFKAAFGGLQ